MQSVVHLVRHGQVHNPDGILYGRLPGYGLSDIGRAMAQRLGDNVFWKPFQQSTPRVIADKRLFDMIRDGQMEHSGEPVLRQHILNADRKPEEDKLRIIKRVQTQKIDAVVALSMAVDRLMYYR